MKLLKLLFVVLLFACNDDSKDTPTTGEPKQIVVEMDAAASNVTDIPLLKWDNFKSKMLH